MTGASERTRELVVVVQDCEDFDEAVRHATRFLAAEREKALEEAEGVMFDLWCDCGASRTHGIHEGDCSGSVAVKQVRAALRRPATGGSE